MDNKKDQEDMTRLRDHMANERTFLAWIRTCIGIMAFGFVVEKFSYFIRELSLFWDKPMYSALSKHLQGYSSSLGSILIILGAFLCLLAFFKYKKIENQIKTARYHPTLLLDIMLMISVVFIGIFLAMVLTI